LFETAFYFGSQAATLRLIMLDVTRTFFQDLLKNAVRCFKGYNLLWHLLAIVLTCFILNSGFDWYYFIATRMPGLRGYLFPAVRLGMFLPVILPLSLLAVYAVNRSFRFRNTALALAQTAVLGLVISSLYKAFTGRIPPPHFFRNALPGPLADTSHGFRFGFLRGGMFWGWPSSHTSVAFAMAVALWKLYPENRIVRYGAILYALYVGIAVSMSIHWFSEFAAGAIIGSVIGAVVGECFYRKARA
jgi:membrane-associated phospholipid phosphatase